MTDSRAERRARNLTGRTRAARFLTVFLCVAFLDELAFGARDAAWPFIRTDLGFGYVALGLLLGLPKLVELGMDPVIGTLADAGHKRALVLAGGIADAARLLPLGASPGFAAVLGAVLVLAPASSAFVSLSQATLMDAR